MHTERLYFIIFSLYKELQITKLPINCADILTQRGYRLMKYSDLSSKKRDACLRLSSDSCIIADTLYYNENKNNDRIRFSMMHELGHIILDTLDEDEADCFASHMLAPRIAIHRLSCKTADAIHNAFGLSYMASNRVLADYRNWLYNISRTCGKPTIPELALQELLFPGQASETNSSLHNDGVNTEIKRTKRSKKTIRRKQELVERMEFFEEMNQEYGDDYSFARANEQYLLGNDY